MAIPIDIPTRQFIAANLAAGISQTDIAAALGRDQSTIAHHARNPITRALIEQYQQDISDAMMPVIRDATISLVTQYHQSIATPNDIPVTGREAIKIEHGGKIVRGMLQSIGVLPSHAPSVMIQQIFSQTNVSLVPDAISEVFRSYLGQLTGQAQDASQSDPVIDLPPTE